MNEGASGGRSAPVISFYLLFKQKRAQNKIALMKIFKTLKSKGVTVEQIYKMIDMFAHEIKQTPLPQDVTTWKGFASRLDSLKKKVDTPIAKFDYSEYTVDKRLKRGNND